MRCEGASRAAGLGFFLGGKSGLWGKQGIVGFACTNLPLAQLGGLHEAKLVFAVYTGPSSPWCNSPGGSRNGGGTTLARKAAATAQHQVTRQLQVSEFNWRGVRFLTGADTFKMHWLLDTSLKPLWTCLFKTKWKSKAFF